MQNIGEKVYKHPDRDEIISKLCADQPIKDISEWLAMKYDNTESREFMLTVRMLTEFKKNYLDFYNIMKDDLAAIKSSQSITNTSDVSSGLQQNSAYQSALAKYANEEIDIKLSVKKMVSAIEMRAAQVFDEIQNDASNLRNDRVLIEWFNTLIAALSSCNEIINGSPDQINIQNNINIQILDSHINAVYEVIKDILSKLDYDTSIMFIEMFNEKMTQLKKSAEIQAIPIEIRTEEAKLLADKVVDKINQ